MYLPWKLEGVLGIYDKDFFSHYSLNNNQIEIIKKFIEINNEFVTELNYEYTCFSKTNCT